jgi:polyphosphate kinase
MSETPAIGPVELIVRGKQRVFDVTDPQLPAWIDDNDLTADDFPYKEKMPREEFDARY